MKQRVPISLTVNGEIHELFIPPWQLLLDTLRDELGLTGAKRCCIEGQCGACTVLIDGKPINSCLYLTIEAQNQEIVTAEGLVEDGKPHPIQKAFVERGAVQCGFCTPGLVVATKALLDQNPNPTEDEIRIALSGHLCRCGAYVQITEAVMAAARETAQKEVGV
ncbi:MAG: (2Fe-2S)-binding protein [Candidatus Tectomicrobia bacterium]|uniref:(2Fe-2S)-binding protein n=1 Tax=Tectimicrobiota bacterium TaxID=2528274 RepID=A0A932M1P5_UNCTE|nr:(2Fe-2S)-binding protein [Candidatus Tectomicrobia bacterium]